MHTVTSLQIALITALAFLFTVIGVFTHGGSVTHDLNAYGNPKTETRAEGRPRLGQVLVIVGILLAARVALALVAP